MLSSSISTHVVRHVIVFVVIFHFNVPNGNLHLHFVANNKSTVHHELPIQTTITRVIFHPKYAEVLQKKLATIGETRTRFDVRVRERRAPR